MHGQTRRTIVDPALENAWKQLQAQYAEFHNAAPFWSAYQALQDELTQAHPHRRIALCNQLAQLAERLGVVEHAQLLNVPPPEPVRHARHTGSTPP